MSTLPPPSTTRYSVQDLANLWTAEGGSPTNVIDAVAVALAESGGRVYAVSPSHDYGLWQINGIHFGDGTINADNWSDPHVNAREAIRLSGDGANWAAWCTAWLHPAGNCGHGHLPHPQSGSPAARQLYTVERGLGYITGGPAAPAAKSGTPGRLTDTDTYMHWFYGEWFPQRRASLAAWRSYAEYIR